MARGAASATMARRTRALQERRQQQRDNDVRAVLSTVEGRRLWWWLMDDVCGLHSGGFGGDTADLTYREGGRWVGLELMRHAQRVAPDNYVLALQERVSAAREEQLQREDAEATAEKETEENA